MKRVLLAVLAIGTLAAPLAAVTSAQAQVPPRSGPYGDRDRDGIPNAYDRYDNRRAYNGAWGDRDHDGIPNKYDRYDNRRASNGAWGDRDHDGIPNKYDRYDNRALRDSDHDGVPNAWDRNAHNPYVR